jgi:hypothetical protein
LHAVSLTGNGYQIHQENIHSLAYLDDLLLIAQTPDDLQSLLDVTDWAGLRFNVSKCATLHMLHIDGKRKEVLPTVFNIYGNTPTALAEGDFHENLGVPTGYHVASQQRKYSQG